MQRRRLAPTARRLALHRSWRRGRAMCVICLDRTPCVVLLPCRHLSVCADAECAAMLCGACPLCRTAVAETLTVFPL